MKTSWIRKAGCVLGMAMSWFFGASAPAAPGDLDLTFGAGTGKVVTDFGYNDYPAKAVVQPDGKILVAGSAYETGGFAFARYLPNGTLDPSFGNGTGKVLIGFGPSAGNPGCGGVALQADGKIVAVGNRGDWSAKDFAVIRLNPDGSLDTSFGAGTGKVSTDFGGPEDIAYEVDLQADGKIVVSGMAGWPGSHHFAVARYNTDGTLDASFGAGGKVTTDFGGDDVYPQVAVQSDGRIVLAGCTKAAPNQNYGFALARYNADGTLDPTFGNGGKVTTDLSSGMDSISAVAIQPDGRIVVGGYASLSHALLALVRYNADGTLDSAFGGGTGIVTTDMGAYCWITSLKLQADGKIVFSGGYDGNGTRVFVVGRYTSSGTLDPGFGSGTGIVTSNFGYGYAAALALQPDSNIIAVGGAGGNFVVARYQGGDPVDPCAALQAALDAANAQIAQLQADNAALTGQVNTLTSQNASLSSQLAQSQAALATANAVIQTLQAQNASLSAANQQLQIQVSTLTAQNTALTSQLNGLQSQMQALAAKLGGGFGNPGFQVPGASLTLQLEALAKAIGNLNHGQQQALYFNLGGSKK